MPRGHCRRVERLITAKLTVKPMPADQPHGNGSQRRPQERRPPLRLLLVPCTPPRVQPCASAEPTRAPQQKYSRDQNCPLRAHSVHECPGRGLQCHRYDAAQGQRQAHALRIPARRGEIRRQKRTEPCLHIGKEEALCLNRPNAAYFLYRQMSRRLCRFRVRCAPSTGSVPRQGFGCRLSYVCSARTFGSP